MRRQIGVLNWIVRWEKVRIPGDDIPHLALGGYCFDLYNDIELDGLCLLLCHQLEAQELTDSG